MPQANDQQASSEAPKGPKPDDQGSTMINSLVCAREDAEGLISLAWEWWCQSRMIAGSTTPPEPGRFSTEMVTRLVQALDTARRHEVAGLRARIDEFVIEQGVGQQQIDELAVKLDAAARRAVEQPITNIKPVTSGPLSQELEVRRLLDAAPSPNPKPSDRTTDR